MKMVNHGSDLAKKLVAFQESGGGFSDVWEAISPMITRMAEERLRKHLVFESRSRVDSTAIDEVCQQVSMKLLGLAKAGQKGRFDPAKAARGASGVARWLFPIVRNEAADYCRMWRSGKGKLKLSTMTGLKMNTLDGAEDSRQPPLKPEPIDLTGILNRCINGLPQKFAAPVRLRLSGVTDREAGKRLGCNGSTINKRIAKATRLLRPLLEAQGIDESCLDLLAA